MKMYLHYFEQVSNTGLTLNLLQKYLFIPLDIFKEKQHNEGNRIDNKLEEVMQIFSKELADLDRNTVQLMIDEMQEEINSQKEEINIQKQELKNAQAEKYRMIERLCQSIGDIEKAAGLLGISVDEIQSVLEYNA